MNNTIKLFENSIKSNNGNPLDLEKIEHFLELEKKKREEEIKKQRKREKRLKEKEEYEKCALLVKCKNYK